MLLNYKLILENYEIYDISLDDIQVKSGNQQLDLLFSDFYLDHEMNIDSLLYNYPEISNFNKVKTIDELVSIFFEYLHLLDLTKTTLQKLRVDYMSNILFYIFKEHINSSWLNINDYAKFFRYLQTNQESFPNS